ncbi:MAG: methionine adenosyltransferase [Chromatiaceae bacterium]
MTVDDYVFTSESVTEGHPDKLSDIISDAIVDAYLTQDPWSHVRAECAVAKGVLFVATRFASTGTVDVGDVARRAISDVGYTPEEFSAEDTTIITSLSEALAEEYDPRDERELAADEPDAMLANSQATVFGYACNQTDTLMPLPICLAHRLAVRLTQVRRDAALPYLCADGKTQVGVEFRDGRPSRIHSITLIAAVSASGAPDSPTIADDLRQSVIEPVFADEPVRPDSATRIFVNPDRRFLVGGPARHAGLTGRKNQVDTYGEFARHSGAALSGKDPSRIDRSGAYAARYAAKNLVAAGLAGECEVQLSYSIGLPGPVSVHVRTFNSGRLDDAELSRRTRETFDFRVAPILRDLDLRHQSVAHQGRFYQRLAAYGHMGRADLDVPWERTDRLDALQG